jgi:hypothetical protein
MGCEAFGEKAPEFFPRSQANAAKHKGFAGREEEGRREETYRYVASKANMRSESCLQLWKQQQQ